MKFSFEISRKKAETLPLMPTKQQLLKWVEGMAFWNNATNRTNKELKENGWGKNPYVYMVINDIARIVKSLDYQFTVGEKEIASGKTYDLFQRPNDEQYFTEFMESAVIELLSLGEIFIAKTDSIGFDYPVELQILKGQFVEIIVDGSNEINKYNYTFNNKLIPYKPEDILHIKFANPIYNLPEKSFRGYSPLRVLDRVYNASNSNFAAEAAILENRGVQGFISSDNAEMPLVGNDKELLQQAFDRRHNGSDKFGKIAVSGTAARYVPVGANSADLQLLDSNVAKLRVICAVYGLSSQLFGDQASSTYNNMETAEKAAYLKCYLPTANFIIDQFNKWIKDTLKSKEVIKINIKAIEVLNKIDKTYSDKIIAEINAGILSQQQGFELLYGDSDLTFDVTNAKRTYERQNQNNQG